MINFKSTTALATLLAASLALPAAANHHSDKKGDSMKAEKMMKDGKMKAKTIAFSDIDINADGQLDFTEFADFGESKMGMSATDSATQFVRFADDRGVITQATYNSMSVSDALNGMHDKASDHNMTSTSKTTLSNNGMTETTTTRTMTKTSSGTMMDVKPMTGTMTKTETTMTETTSRPTVSVKSETMTMGTVRSDANKMADYGRFTDYDANADGNVSFMEYSKARKKTGVQTTKAAQEFMRLSNGTAMFDETRYNSSMSADVLGQKVYTRSVVSPR